MDKLENLISMSKLNNLINKQEEEKKQKKKVCCILIVIGAVIALVAVAYGIYKHLKPDYLDEFDDDFEDDDFEEDFLDEECVAISYNGYK